MDQRDKASKTTAREESTLKPFHLQTTSKISYHHTRKMNLREENYHRTFRLQLMELKIVI